MNTSKVFQVTEIDLVYKTPNDYCDRPVIRNSKDAYQLFLQSWEDGKMELIEQFRVLFMSNSGKVIGVYNASSGGTTQTVVDIKLILVAAMKANTTKMILAHNHPSGSLKPSDADKTITTKICNAGKLLDITIDDHIILTQESYFSFRDEGLI